MNKMRFWIYFFLALIIAFDLRAAEENLSPSYVFMLVPYRRTSFTSVNNSKVSKIYKHMGDSFSKGEILIQLDDVIQESLYQKALAVLEKAKTTYESKKILFEGKVASRDELINMRTELSLAENDVIIAKKNLDDCAIVAQYDGRVSFLNVEVAEYPNHEFYYKDKPMMETIDEEILLARVLVPANLFFQLQKGQNVRLTINETGTVVMAPIVRIGALIDPASSTVLIEAEVENKERKYIGGMSGLAQIDFTGPTNKQDAP